MPVPQLRSRRAAWVRRTGVVGALLLGLGGAHLAGASAVAAPVLAASAIPAPACTTPAPSTAAGWQRAFDDLQGAGWSGGDQATSTRLPDGRILWLFGDTVQSGVRPDGSRAPGAQMVHNSLVLADGGCLTPVTGPDGAEVVPSTADGQYFWPQQAFLAGSTLYATVLRVHAVGDSFEITGTYLARFDYLPGGTPSFAALSELPSSGTPDTEVQWGTAVAQSGGDTYLYGTRRVDRAGVFGKALYVARVGTDRVAEPAAWRYWDGDRWVPGEHRAREVKDAVGGVSTTLTVWQAPDGGWRAVTKKDDVFGHEVVELRSAAPTGPWQETVIGTAPSGGSTGQLQYNAVAHPEIAVAGGVLVSVSRNSTSAAELAADADLYKPQFSLADRR